MTVEVIGKGGEGSKAYIEIQLRDEFPGIGGRIDTYQEIAVAHRKETEDKPEIGYKRFLTHALIKKLEDFFFVTGKYRYAHITRPLGSTPEGYIYEWAPGSDGFPWMYTGRDGEPIHLNLGDWNTFVGAFDSAGIDLQYDCTDANDGRISKNIVHLLCSNVDPYEPTLSSLWKRIDLGPESIRIDYDQVLSYLERNGPEMKRMLKPGRHGFMMLACRYLMNNGDIDPIDLGRLELSALDYRISTLEHLNRRGVESTNNIRVL